MKNSAFSFAANLKPADRQLQPGKRTFPAPSFFLLYNIISSSILTFAPLLSKVTSVFNGSATVGQTMGARPAA